MQTHEEQCTKLRETVAMLRVLVSKQSVRIADQARALEMLTKTGQMGVPVIDINGDIIVGFDKDKIKRALEI